MEHPREIAKRIETKERREMLVKLLAEYFRNHGFSLAISQKISAVVDEYEVFVKTAIKAEEIHSNSGMRGDHSKLLLDLLRKRKIRVETNLKKATRSF